MPRKLDSMHHPRALLHALDGVEIAPPKILGHIASGFEILGEPIQPAGPDPALAVVDAAVSGKLTAKALDGLLATAAAQAATNAYRQEFRLKAERKFAHRFHAVLIDGAADEILDSIRPAFDTTAQKLSAARDAVDLHATPERLLTVTATPEEQAAWSQLPELIRQVTRLAAIAAAFGPTADLPVIDDLTQHDTLLRLEWLDPRALMCCGGDTATVSKTFHQPDATWQQSPWLRVPLELQTIAAAQERYREAAESDWAAREQQFQGSGTLTDDGFVPHSRPNPHARRETVDA